MNYPEDFYNKLFKSLDQSSRYIVDLLNGYIRRLDLDTDIGNLFDERRPEHDYQKIKICELLVDDFQRAEFKHTRFDIDPKDMIAYGGYEYPTKPIFGIEDMYSLPQLANNNFRIHIKMFIEPFSTVCRFRTLLVRDDGWALVQISEIESTQTPEDSRRSGFTLITRNEYDSPNPHYLPICVVNLGSKFVHKGWWDNGWKTDENDPTGLALRDAEYYSLIIDESDVEPDDIE